MTINLIRAVIIYFVVVAAVRIMGKRQIGQLKPHEFVITILISAVATVPLEENSMPLANSLIPILIFISLEIIQSALSMKSLRFRNIMQGKPIFIIKDGKLQQRELSRLRFTMDDLIDSLRQENVFDISHVQNAIVETNGNITVQTKAEHSPITPSDMQMGVSEVDVPIPIVMDSKPIEEYFGSTKIKSSEITLITKSNDVEIDEIMLMTIDSSAKAYIIKKEKAK